MFPVSTKGLISKRVSQLAPSGIRRFFDLLSSLEGVISLGVGEPDFVTPWHIREAAIYALEKGRTMYTSNAGMPELRQALAQDMEDRYGLSYEPDRQIVITVGVSEALDLAMRAILDPDDEVLIPDPSYVAYSPCVLLTGGRPVLVSTNLENEFKLRPQDVEQRITGRTKAILVGYPANPTGAVMSRDELSEIADIARRHHLLVISDEVYARLVYGVRHTCFATLPGMGEQTILLGGFSKAHAMTGWRLGYAAGPDEVIAAMTKVHQYTMLCAPIIAQMAALEAIKRGDKDVADMVTQYDQRRRVMVKGLNELGLTCFEPRGAFYAFPSIKSTGLSSEEFAERLLVEEKVAVVPGTAFGPSGEGHIRCCYATSLPDIEKALEKMQRFLSRHRS